METMKVDFKTAQTGLFVEAHQALTILYEMLNDESDPLFRGRIYEQIEDVLARELPAESRGFSSGEPRRKKNR